MESSSVGEAREGEEAECCTVLYGNNNWYLLLRLFYILCDRLCYFHSHAEKAKVDATTAAEQKTDHSVVDTAYALCLRTPSESALTCIIVSGNAMCRVNRCPRMQQPVAPSVHDCVQRATPTTLQPRPQT